ncbi:MAG: VOC family protein [Rhodoferax sp.]|jgi:catechol 2,3-dioxygenase-like lactoylglutathione lyase family enzyme|nr:VOC family protein [Rhodoferax sp.]
MSSFVPVHGLHHVAYRCRDAEETRHFYEDLLGLPLVHVVREDHVGSTGEYCPFIHLFFEMTDGSSVAFFDLGDNQAVEPWPNTPRWVNHLALRVGSEAEVDEAKRRLEAAGVEVLGPALHGGFVRSIYFFDPNGIRLELTLTTSKQEELQRFHREARAACDTWTRDKAARQAVAV